MTENKLFKKQGERLKKIRFELGFDKKQEEFAISIDSQQSSLSAIEKGKRGISSKMLYRIANKYKKINLQWLLTGNGSVFLEESTFFNGGNLNISNNSEKVFQQNISPSNLDYVKKLEQENYNLKIELIKAKDKIISLLEK